MLDFLPDGVTATAFGVLASTAFVAAMARGFSGFGGALIFIPVASAIIGPKTAVPLILLIDGVLSAGLLPKAWPLADKEEVAIMVAGALVGVPAGTRLLASTDPMVIRWAIVLLAGGMLALLASGWRYHGKPTTAATLGVGALSGICTGAAQVGGPPLVVYWLGGIIPAATARANMVLFFALSTVISVVSYLTGGLFTRTALSLALIIAPAYGVGLFVGSRLFGLAGESTFRRICFGLIALAVLLGLPTLDGFIR
ncbi:MAG TPA: sulfite exporter TauE/SafE family protein [Terriglobia bacterium]|nr:sulfite exporter TauE/SafE family protein [Terriglobia bacterium]